MTAQNRTTNKAKFENGDKPQGSDYVDLIDSFLSLADSSAQSVASHVTFSGGLSTTTASVASLNSTDIVFVSAAGTKLDVSSVSAAVVAAASGAFTSLSVNGENVKGAGASGAIYTQSPGQTVITTATSYVKVSATTTAVSSVLANFDMPANGRLRYTGTDTRKFSIAAYWSATCTTNSQILGAAISKNGNVLPSSIIERKIGTGGDVGAAALGCITDMKTNDYIEVFVTNYSGTAAVLTKRLGLKVEEI